MKVCRRISLNNLVLALSQDDALTSEVDHAELSFAGIGLPPTACFWAVCCIEYCTDLWPALREQIQHFLDHLDSNLYHSTSFRRSFHGLTSMVFAKGCSMSSGNILIATSASLGYVLW